MSETIAPVNRAVAGKRGKYHRTAPAVTGGANDTTRCGKWTRDFTVERDINTTAPEDRCRICWPSEAVVAAGGGGEEADDARPYLG